MTARFVSSPSPSSEGTPPAPGIGLLQGVALYVCAILGAGVLVLPGQVASLAGPASLIAWGFSVVLSVPLAFTFARLATTYPDAGGVAVFARHAFGNTISGIAGWWYFIAGSVGQTIVPLTAGYYICDAIGCGPSFAPLFAAAILGAAVLTGVAGLRVGGVVQVVLAAGVCVVLLVAIAAAIPQIHWVAFTPFAPQGITGIGVAVVVLFYAFSGWEAVAHLASDFRNVGRTLPRATLLTLVVVAVLYLGIAVAVVGTNSYGSTEIDTVSLGNIVGSQFGLSPAIALAVAATVICAGTTNAFMASVSRLGYALGRDGWAPASFARKNGRGAPVTAVLWVTGIGVLGLVGVAVFGWGTADLVFIPSTLVLTTYLVATAAGVRLLPGRQKALPAMAFALILIVTPSAGWYLAVPALVALAAVAYRGPAARSKRPV
ncbi:amino acid permease [Nakamurella silvestris]|nr:amino acid permease [Nakamurella silvestris]